MVVSIPRSSHLPAKDAARLTEVLRHATGLSYDKCKTGVAALLQCLISNQISASQYPGICQLLEQVGCSLCISQMHA